MQICQLTGAEADRVEHFGFVPDCHFHGHLSKGDAHQLAADGKVRFVSSRAVVAVGSASVSGYWYDKAVKKSDRHPGTAKSGPVRTRQLLKFMPRTMKHTVRDIKACGARRRQMSAAATNHQRESFVESKRMITQMTA
jgi:hypothetical protein